MQCTYLFCYLLEVHIGFPPTPLSSNWIAPLNDTSQSTQERHITCTSASFQFHHLTLYVSLPLYDEMQLQYSNSLWTHGKLNTLCISAVIQAFGCNHRKGNIFLQLQWKGLVLMYETKNFLSSLSCIPILSLFYTHSQESQISEECNKNVNLTSRITKNVFSIFTNFMTPETVERCQILQEGMIL
jgi:hypothetical protein